MPVSKKDLYISDNLTNLNKRIEDSSTLSSNVKVATNSMQKLHKAADEADLLGDEERAYILYMRFIALYQRIRRLPDFKKDAKYYESMIGKKNVQVALEKSERLSSSLTERYELKEAMAVSEKIASERERRHSKPENDDDRSTNDEQNERNFDSGVISPMELYDIMKAEKETFLVMDLRSANNYKKSRMKFDKCINVPKNILPPGSTCRYVGQSLELIYETLWKQRNQFDYVVLVDDRSSAEELTKNHPIQVLKDAMTKWEQEVLLKRPPLLLEGGFESWLLHYPILTTDSSYKIEILNGPDVTASPIPSLDFHFPDVIARKDTKVITTFVEDGDADAPKVNAQETKEVNGPVIAVADTNEVNGAVIAAAGPSKAAEGATTTLYPSVPADGLFAVSSKKASSTSTAKSSPPVVDRKLKPSSSSKIGSPKPSNVRPHASNESLKRTDVSTSAPKIEPVVPPTKTDTGVSVQTNIVDPAPDTKLIGEEVPDKVKRNSSEAKPSVTDERKSHQVPATEQSKNVELKDLSSKGSVSTPTVGVSEPKSSSEMSVQTQPLVDRQIKPQQPRRETAAPQFLPDHITRKLDQKTGRYFYIDHRRKTTSWNPPEEAFPERPPEYDEGSTTDSDKAAVAGKKYEALKGEPAVSSSSGLKRSNSSPNVAQMAHAKDQLPASQSASRSTTSTASTRSTTPRVDRTVKPKVSPMEAAALRKFELFAARPRDLQPVYGSKGRGVAGLRNLGNTCYMNSIIQLLSNTAPLAASFLKGDYRKNINLSNFLGSAGQITEEFAHVVRSLWCNQYRSISPRNLKETIGVFEDRFSGFTQQDSQEFLAFIMDKLHEDLNLVRRRPKVPEEDLDNLPDLEAARKSWEIHKMFNNSLIVNLFQGQLKSTLVCLTCRKRSTKFDAFMYLSLELPAASRCSLHDCLQLFLSEERMTGESRWFCPRCKTPREAIKKIDIWKLPPVLIIHLKRFSLTAYTQWQKSNVMVDFPITSMQLAAITAGPTKPAPYRLYAVSNHYGTMEGGHYTACAQNAETKRWYKFDDNEVHTMSNSDVRTPAAYILLYTNMTDVRWAQR